MRIKRGALIEAYKTGDTRNVMTIARLGGDTF